MAKVEVYIASEGDPRYYDVGKQQLAVVKVLASATRGTQAAQEVTIRATEDFLKKATETKS